jgi:hypothetical protein
MGPANWREERRMCTGNVGVAKRIDVEKISKEIADLIKTLEQEIHGDDVEIPVQQVEHVRGRLGKLIE